MEGDSRARTGLIIGKFLPPHRGHVRLVELALRRVDELTILVCSLQDEPIDGALRAAWMRELFPSARVVHVTDENPSFPHEHPCFWDLWVATIRRHVQTGPDIVFTSEGYGDELARRLRARHECFDLERKHVPVSGTAIRNDPYANWEHLPDCVRPFYAKRVVITGSECTGKTTLAEALARHYRTAWVPEFGRTYIDRKNAPFEPGDIRAIVEGQVASEDLAARAANKLLILDTDLISTAVYSAHYFGEAPEIIVSTLAGRKRADLYLLADIDVPWVADGLHRDRETMREDMQELFRDALRARGQAWVNVRGTRDERMRSAIEAIDALFRARGRTL
ncbi:MAG TPA: AAA family ATPase [Thermoanaerobaculia bacterium]|nr:AAA family ATPase [Thermoanaerobaculia bacterium]